ncbi:MAG: hypothetical protein DHS20C18_11730 [Saprospiraceae bacterium]|nr:MAG: hypothetical protein DHS20C18_11730 [Saprospiraceae bacterium]
MTNNVLIAELERHIEKYFEESIPADYVYHDLYHTQSVVQSALDIARGYNLSEQELEVLQIAAWFHDVGYTEGQEGHEKRGCEKAREFLCKYQYPEASVKLVEGCILATKIPQSPRHLIEEILCDADLSHLGMDQYWDRCGRVRQEMLLIHGVVMSEQEWVDFEMGFMTRHRYHTEAGRKLYEKQKEKHVRQLYKRKLRLNPGISEESMEFPVPIKAKKKKKKKDKEDDIPKGLELKQLNLGRGVETMYRTTYRTHVNLSSIADNKANIMLSINAIIISIIVANLVPRLETNTKLIIPTLVLLAVCLVALVFAILATQPKVTEGVFTREDIENKRSNLLFFGNFYNMNLKDFEWGMTEMIKDSDFLYSSMTRDIYYLGVVLAKKYWYLRICYSVFMYGLIFAVCLFALAFLI